MSGPGEPNPGLLLGWPATADIPRNGGAPPPLPEAAQPGGARAGPGRRPLQVG